VSEILSLFSGLLFVGEFVQANKKAIIKIRPDRNLEGEVFI
jgi:hypothetical protein